MPAREIAKEMRPEVKQPDGAKVRLTGRFETGKTRLLEALFDPSIGEQPLDAAHAI